MEKSKYYHYIKVNDEVIAVFNSLILDIAYISKKDFNLLNKRQFDKIEKNKIDSYLKKGILIINNDEDEKAYSILYNHYINDCRKLDFMYLILSQGCNLGCKYCFLENMNANWKNQKMNFDTAKIAIDKYVEHIKKNNILDASIMLFGGEPLINWELFKKVVSYSKKEYPEFFNKNSKQKISFRTVTNGTLIDEEKAKYFKSNNIIPAISLDGPKLINDENRVFKAGNRSVYDSVMKAIKILKEQGCPFGLSITLSKEVVEDKKNIIAWLKEIDVKDIYFNPLHYNEKNNEWQEHYINSTKFIIDSFFTLLENDIVNGRPIRQINSFVDRSFYFSDCGSAGVHQITVKPNGDILICQCDYNSKVNKIGNIIKDDLEIVINSKKTDRWIKAVPIMKKKCLNCESIFICGGACLTQNTNMFDSSCMVDQTYCIYIKLMLEWLIRRWYEERR